MKQHIYKTANHTRLFLGSTTWQSSTSIRQNLSSMTLTALYKSPWALMQRSHKFSVSCPCNEAVMLKNSFVKINILSLLELVIHWAVG